VVFSSSGFGLAANVDMPEGCNVIIVCVNGGSHYQLFPVALLLPHQLYYNDAKRLLKEHNATEIVVIPARSENYIDIPAKSLNRARSRKARA